MVATTDLSRALDAAAAALVCASTHDLPSVDAALERLERATGLLAQVQVDGEAHAGLRSQVEQVALATHRIFQDVVSARDSAAAELAATRRTGEELEAPERNRIDLTR